VGGTFLAAIEATIVATAMPTVVTQLGGLAHYSWVFSAYILTSTVTMPLWGKLSDLHGRRRFYLASIGVFLFGSALCGMAQSMPQLIACRALQGIGAGGLLPLGMTILGDLYTLQERGKAQALLSGAWGLASILGPLVGGSVTDHFSWRWVFYLNLPFGAVAAALVGANLIDAPRHGRARIDYRGAVLMAACVTLLLLALGQTGTREAVLTPWQVVALYAGSLALGYGFVRLESSSEEPIVPFELMRDPLVAATILAGFLVGIAMFGVLTFVPLFVQSALGGTASDAGRALSPLLLGWVVMSVVTGRLLPRVGFRPIILGGLALVCLGFLGLLRVDRSTGMGPLAIDLGLMGMGMGMTLLSLLLALQHAVPQKRLGVATSLGQFTRSVGAAVGVAMMGAILAASLPPGGEGDARLMEIGLHRAFMAGAVVAALALLAGLRVPSGVPSRPAGLDSPGTGSAAKPAAAGE
jgi:EmrB/QacA subfamily drug resistance transporter